MDSAEDNFTFVGDGVGCSFFLQDGFFAHFATAVGRVLLLHQTRSVYNYVLRRFPERDCIMATLDKAKNVQPNFN